MSTDEVLPTTVNQADDVLACVAAPGPGDSGAQRATTARLLSGAALASASEVTGTVVEEQAARLALRDDDLVLAALTEQLISALGLADTPQQRTDLLVTLAAAAQRTVQKVADTRYNPENPYDGRGLTRTLRAIAGYTVDGRPDLDEAGRLARVAIAQLTAVLGVDAARLPDLVRALPSGLDGGPDDEDDDPLMAILDLFWDEAEAVEDTPIWDEPPDPPPPDDPVAKLLAARGEPLAPPGALPAGVAKIAPKVVRELLKLLSVKHLRRLMRLSVPVVTRRKAAGFATSHAGAPSNTSADGYEVERAIRLLYLQQRATGPVLFGNQVGSKPTGATVPTSPIGAVAGADPLWDGVRTGLLSFFTGAFGEPDILDPYVAPGIGHVYEIKPARRAREGLKQLGCRYLFWLNLYEVAAANGELLALEAAAWAARLCLGREFAAPPFAAKGRTLNPPARLWTPGDWVPPKSIPMTGNRVAYLEVPVPGVICYVVAKADKGGQPEPVPSPAAEQQQKATMLAAMTMAAIAAGDRRHPEGLDALARSWQAPYRSAPPGQTTDPQWEAAWSAMVVVLIVAGVAAAVLTLGPPTAAGLTAKGAELFASGGTAALWAAAAGGPR